MVLTLSDACAIPARMLARRMNVAAMAMVLAAIERDGLIITRKVLGDLRVAFWFSPISQLCISIVFPSLT
jgi:hypothetical protein